jgi:prepilin-type N-terminal cleavage/methylation domain-containing protein
MTRTPRGFTLIELLIVVVIIGILASIAIPKFANTKDRANQTAMKSDLRNLATAMEAYFNDNNSTYPSVIASLGSNYHISTGVTVTLGSVTGSGWAATATHSASPKTCTISVGGSSTNEGVPVCN